VAVRSRRHLLYLLAEHTGIEARIEPPENWVDPYPDMVTDEPPMDRSPGDGTTRENEHL
jgi:hypothetical protein